MVSKCAVETTESQLMRQDSFEDLNEIKYPSVSIVKKEQKCNTIAISYIQSLKQNDPLRHWDRNEIEMEVSQNDEELLMKEFRRW